MTGRGVLAREIGLALALLASLAVPAGARADAVAMGDFSGRHGDAVRQRVVDALGEAGIDVVDDPGGPSGTVEGRVRQRGRRWRAVLRLRDADGAEVLTERFAARSASGLAARIRRWVEGDLAEAIRELGPAAPAAASPPPDPYAEEDDEADAPAPSVDDAVEDGRAGGDEGPEPETPGDGAPVPPFAATLGFSAIHRSFTYHDDIFGQLAPYEFPLAPLATLELEYFPAAHVDEPGALRGFSITAAGEYAIAVSTVENDVDYPTDWWGLTVGVRYRYRVDDVVLRVDGGYQAFVFTVHDANELQPRPPLPNLELHILRAGAGMRIDVGLGLFFEGYGAYLQPVATGEIGSEEWFPRLFAGGAEAEAALGLEVDDVTFRALFTMRRFFYAMNSEPGDTRVAGGAVDQSLAGTFRFTYRPSGL